MYVLRTLPRTIVVWWLFFFFIFVHSFCCYRCHKYKFKWNRLCEWEKKTGLIWVLVTISAQWLNDEADLVMAFRWVFFNRTSSLSFSLFMSSNGIWCVERIGVFFLVYFSLYFGYLPFITLPSKYGTFSVLLQTIHNKHFWQTLLIDVC